ncbi:MAG TPA: Crp/Fnr family transcriptional regulator [Ohtaekwangia sp.]
MTNELKSFLTQFNSFSPEEVEAIIESMAVKAFPKGAILLREDELTSTCYFIVKGCIRQYQLLDGEEKTIAFFTEHQPVISYSSYLERTPSQYTYQCIEDCELVAGTRESEQKLHKQFPRLEFMTQIVLQKDYQAVQNQLATMINLSAEERYQNLIETRPELLLRVPLQYIASYLGITPESFSRIRKRVTIREKNQSIG